MQTNYKPVSIILSVFAVLFFIQPSVASAAITVCQGSPAFNLNWSVTNASSCVGGLQPVYSGTDASCSFAVSTSTPNGKKTIASTASCHVEMHCKSSTNKDLIPPVSDDLIYDGTKVWNGTACVVAPTCANGAIATSYPACNQCPANLAYIAKSCVACSNGGCTGNGGSDANPLGGLSCINKANNPISCTTCTLPSAMVGGICTAPAKPVVDLQVNGKTGDTIVSGQSVSLTWSSTGATSCTAVGGFSTGGAATNNSGVSVGPLSSVQNYQIYCDGAGGRTYSGIVSVTVRNPKVTISASPSRVQRGNPTKVTWSATNTKTCKVMNSTSSTPLASGNESVVNAAATPPISVTINSQTAFTIACTTEAGAGYDQTATTIVNVTPAFQEF